MDNTGRTICELCGQDLPIDEETFAGRLRGARVSAAFSERGLGKRIGYKNGAQITRWESGARGMPDSLTLLNLMADELGVEVGYLMGTGQRTIYDGIGDAPEGSGLIKTVAGERSEGEVRSQG